MRGVEIFSGTSHPVLAEAICERLGTLPAKCSLGNFSNGETSVNIGVSVRNKDVFIVQSGSTKINDSVMELLIMIAACKGGSAKSITAVMPYFPYSRQSKKKSHRGAITARMLANLLSVAGVNHVITVDLHASQMQGFFGKPVDNLFAEPLIARWIQANVRDWRDGVVVSKNAGGTKRVTSLADALKLNFGIVTTDRRRNNMSASMMMDNSVLFDGPGGGYGPDPPSPDQEPEPDKPDEHRKPLSQRHRPTANGFPSPTSVPQRVFTSNIPSSPLVQSTRADSASPSRSQTRLTRATTAPTAPSPTSPTLEEGDDEYTDERAREVITARLMGGHVVDDDYPSPSISAMSGPPTANPADPLPDPFDNTPHDPMACSFESTASSFQPDHALGGTFDAAASSDEEDKGLKNPELEQTVTLVGQVREKVVFLVDDMIDKSASWIAAAETVVKRGGAKKVYCIGTHGLFGDESLEEMERCECIDFIVVTNSFPISKQKVKECKKLVVLDLATLLSEAIRRNHYGESISALFQLHD